MFACLLKVDMDEIFAAKGGASDFVGGAAAQIARDPRQPGIFDAGAAWGAAENDDAFGGSDEQVAEPGPRKADGGYMLDQVFLALRPLSFLVF